VLFAATTTRREATEPDVARVIRAVVDGRALAVMPYLPEASLRRGLDLLLDDSPVMAPFRDDLAALVDEAVKVVGTSRCRCYVFDADPATAVEDPWPRRPAPWRAEPGRPVLLATTLGIGAPPHARRRPSPARFAAFAHCARRAGAPACRW